MTLIETTCLYTNQQIEERIDLGLDVEFEEMEQGFICFDIEKVESFNPASDPKYTKIVLPNESFNICVPYEQFKSEVLKHGLSEFHKI